MAPGMCLSAIVFWFLPEFYAAWRNAAQAGILLQISDASHQAMLNAVL